MWNERIMKNTSLRVKANCYKVTWRWYLTQVKLKIMKYHPHIVYVRKEEIKGKYSLKLAEYHYPNRKTFMTPQRVGSKTDWLVPSVAL